MNLLRRYKYHIPLISMIALMFSLSSIPGDTFPDANIKLADKIIHTLIYFFLFLTLVYSLKNQSTITLFRKYFLLFALLFTAAYGAFDENYQRLIPFRSCDLYDWVADISGGFIGLLLVQLNLKYNILKNIAKIKFTFII
jgi:VanZ family protein